MEYTEELNGAELNSHVIAQDIQWISAIIANRIDHFMDPENSVYQEPDPPILRAPDLFTRSI